jgi:lysophospholipase L1-like esterase
MVEILSAPPRRDGQAAWRSDRSGTASFWPIVRRTTRPGFWYAGEMTRAGRLSRKLLLLLVTVLLLATLIESAVRLFGPTIEYVPMSQGLIADETLGYRNRPGYDNRAIGGREKGHVVISSQGFRDDVFDARRDGDLRVLVLGDSYSYGHAVEQGELYTEFLEAALARRFEGRRVEVLNTGVPSWATFQQLRLLQRIGPDFQPDVVLLQYCFNDLTGNLNHTDKDVAFLARTVERNSFGGGLLAGFARHSQAARLTFQILFAMKNRKRAEQEAAPAAPPGADARSQGMEFLRELCLDYFHQIEEETTRQGARLALFVVRQGGGDRHQVPPTGDPADHFLIADARSRGIPAITFFEAVQHSNAPFEECNDSHFTVRGHEVAAAALFGLLTTEVLDEDS